MLTVTRLDRLARSTRDLLNTLAAITGKKAGLKSLADTWADTTTSHGRLMLTVLGGMAEFERDLIRARTGEGRARAVAPGQKMGRPFKLTDHQTQEAIKRREQGETLADIGRSYNVSPPRFRGSPGGRPTRHLRVNRSGKIPRPRGRCAPILPPMIRYRLDPKNLRHRRAYRLFRQTATDEKFFPKATRMTDDGQTTGAPTGAPSRPQNLFEYILSMIFFIPI